MKKLKVSSKTVSLPTDFSTIETPIIENPSAKTTATEATVIANETKQISAPEPTPTPPAVPSIDTDAALKIEEADMMPEELPQQEKRGKVLFVVGSAIGILIIAATIFLSLVYFKKVPEQISVPEPTPTATLTENPKVTIPNSDITFEILNGSGVSGQAAVYGKQLETLGFKINKLDNAEGSPTGLAVFITTSLASQKDTLMASIKEELPTASYSGVLIGSVSMVRLIIGK